MKINFTHNEKEYTLCSISEFAEMILKYLCKSKKATKTEFVCDFALSDIYDNDTIDMDRTCDIIMHASGWFGIKELGEIGFNNTDSRQLVLDYYGGQFNSFHSYVADSEVLFDMLKSWGLNGLEFQTESHRIEEILCLMLDTTKTEYRVLVQWTEDEWLGKNQKDEPKKEEYDPDEVCGVDWHNEQVLIMQDQIDDLQKRLKESQSKLVTEVCPECNTENTLVWDVEEDGYVAYCPHCGARMMLCDECQHADDAPETCDCSNCGHCYRD